MREHIKAFLLASSLAFGIPTDLTEWQRDRIFSILHSLVEAEANAHSGLTSMRAETLSRVAAVLTPAQREKLALFHPCIKRQQTGYATLPWADRALRARRRGLPPGNPAHHRKG